MSNVYIYALNSTVMLAKGQSPEGLSSGECECEHFIVKYPLKISHLIDFNIDCDARGKVRGS